MTLTGNNFFCLAHLQFIRPDGELLHHLELIFFFICRLHGTACVEDSISGLTELGHASATTALLRKVYISLTDNYSAQSN